jgi:tetratricopeptide (TPR) repeat protein
MSSTDSTALDSVIAALEMALWRADPTRVLQTATSCLNRQPSIEQAAIASVIAISSHARLGNFNEAQSHLIAARGFYADHLRLPEQQRAAFLQDGRFLDDLRPIGDQELQENPWLYFVLGNNYGPHLPDWYTGEGDSEAVGRNRALRAWADFVSDHPEQMFGTLGYLCFADARYLEGSRYLEKVLLLARNRESVGPLQIELLWPRVILGDCYWESGDRERASACWHSARSADIYMQLESQVDDWSSFALPWIEKARCRLAEHNVPVPTTEVSRNASQCLTKAVQYTLVAEQSVARDVETEEHLASIRQAGRKFTALLDDAASELAKAESLDRFTWAKTPGSPSGWFRYEWIKGMLLIKTAMLHTANGKNTLALLSCKQAMDVWPCLFYCQMIAGLQAACGLVADARMTYQMCIDRADELAADESSEEREEVLREVRQALSELSH